MAFTTRQLSFEFQLGRGSFGSSGADTVKIPPGLWANVRVQKGGSPEFNTADISIAGLQLDLMNKLSRVGLSSIAVRDNIVTVFASDFEGRAQPTLVFAGGIMEAWTDFSQPEAILRITGNTALFQSVRTTKPISFTGDTDIAVIMKQLADDMGFSLENNIVQKIILSNPYLPGSPRSQALAAADAAGIYVYFEDDKKLMVIVEKNRPRNVPVPVISPSTGMVGYPSYVGPGRLALTCEYNPMLRVFGNLELRDSIVENANGRWHVIQLSHDLSTYPDGPWFSRISATNLYFGAGGDGSQTSAGALY